ncbi:MAG: phosphatase PAP2 family protein [Elusimicrobia bacterium]|nr:phosphatase PAP2 family protein [Elusimicrobiota bacterium]
MIRRLTGPAALALLLAAGTAGAKGYERQPPLYLDRAKLSALEFPPAPAADSAVDKADLEEVRSWQKRRTEGQCRDAAAQATATFEELFGDISPFARPLPQEAADFFLQVGIDVDTAVWDVKEREKRPRPFRRDPSIEPCPGLKKPGGYSYPSGHAAISRAYALALTDIAPGRRNEYITRANDAALNRVIGGLHHPSDIAAGKRLADMLYPSLKRDPAFAAQLERMRGYLAAPMEAPR